MNRLKHYYLATTNIVALQIDLFLQVHFVLFISFKLGILESETFHSVEFITNANTQFYTHINLKEKNVFVSGTKFM